MNLKLFLGSIFGITIRVLQILFALLTWALAADAVHSFSVGSMAWLLVCGLISFIYAIVILVLSFAMPSYIIPGAVIVMESLCALFNFTGFIAAAAQWGSDSCSGDVAAGFFVVHYDSTPCRAGKGAIAFGAFNWFLFTITAILFGIFSIGPLIKAHSNLWAPGAMFSGGVLALLSSEEPKTASGTDNVDEEATVGDSPVEKGDETAAPKANSEADPETA